MSFLLIKKIGIVWITLNSSYQVFSPDAEEIRDHHTTNNGLVEEDVDKHGVQEVQFSSEHHELHKQ